MKNIKKHRKGFRIAAASSQWMIFVLPAIAFAQGPAEPVINTPLPGTVKSIVTKPMAPAPQFKVEMQRQIELPPKNAEKNIEPSKAGKNSVGNSALGVRSTSEKASQAAIAETPKAKVAAKFSMLKASDPKPISQVANQTAIEDSIVSPAMPPSLPVTAPVAPTPLPAAKPQVSIPTSIEDSTSAPGVYEMPRGINAFYEKLEGSRSSDWLQPRGNPISSPIIDSNVDNPVRGQSGAGPNSTPLGTAGSSNNIGPIGALPDNTSTRQPSNTAAPSAVVPVPFPSQSSDGSVTNNANSQVGVVADPAIAPGSPPSGYTPSIGPSAPVMNQANTDSTVVDVVPPAPPSFNSKPAANTNTYTSGVESLSGNGTVTVPSMNGTAGVGVDSESPTLQQQYAVPSFIPNVLVDTVAPPDGGSPSATQNSVPKYGLQAPLPTRLPMVPWWQDYTQKPLLTRDRPNLSLYAELDQLVGMSLHHSPKIKSILIVPEIQRSEIGIAQAELDPRAFAQSIYHDTSDPVGNTLTTGGPKRLEDVFWENSVGARDKNSLGGKAEWTQLLNGRDSNSLFFQPNQQADTKLSINYTQPLLRGAGRSYNTATIRIAGLRTSSSIAAANRELQNHVLDISNAYWELVLNRYLLAQAETGQNRLIQIHDRLEGRRDADAIQTQIHRAISAIQTQQGSIGTLRGTINSLQARLKALVNAPELLGPDCIEIIPSTLPSDEYAVPDCSQEMMEALLSRGDILAIQNSIQAASVQKQMAVNELRPQLDALTEVYVRGLRGNYNYGGAFVNQFDTGAVSYFAGLSYQRPVGNRAANNNLIGRRREMEKLISDYENAIVNARSDIMSAVAQSAGAFEALFAAINSTVSSSMEVEQIQADLDHVFTDKTSISNKLQDLLDAEGRLIQAENNWARNQIQYMKALTQIKYESGALMAIMPEVQ